MKIEVYLECGGSISIGPRTHGTINGSLVYRTLGFPTGQYYEVSTRPVKGSTRLTVEKQTLVEDNSNYVYYNVKKLPFFLGFCKEALYKYFNNLPGSLYVRSIERKREVEP